MRQILTRLCYGLQEVVKKTLCARVVIGVSPIFDKSMAWAAEEGHRNRVRLCHEWGATDVEKAMVCAACKSQESIVRLCRNWRVHEIDRVMAYATQEGSESIARLICRALGATDMNWAMVCAASNGHKCIVRMCHDWGGESFDTAWFCYIEIVILCRWGATDLE